MEHAAEGNGLTVARERSGPYHPDMRFVMLLVIALAVGAGFLYVFTNAQRQTQGEIEEQQNAAQDAADAYRKNQEDMMRQLQ